MDINEGSAVIGYAVVVSLPNIFFLPFWLGILFVFFFLSFFIYIQIVFYSEAKINK